MSQLVYNYQYKFTEKGIRDPLRCRGRPCNKKGTCSAAFPFFVFLSFFANVNINTEKGITDPLRCRGRPCNKKGNLLR